MSTILLTGSAGYLGNKVRKALETKGISVIPVDINDPVSSIDLANPDSLKELNVPKQFKLLHLAFPLPGKLNREDFITFVGQVNRNIVSNLQPTESLLISSTAVYSLDHQNDRASLVEPWEVYGILKAETEATFRDKFNNLTVLRPGTLIEESRDSSMASYIKMLQNGRLYFTPGRGTIVHPFTHTEDLVSAIVDWSLRDNVGYKEYLAVSREPLTLEEISSISKSKSRIHIPFPKNILRRIGSDRIPVAGISKWHLSALTYDFKSSLSPYPHVEFRTYREIFQKNH